MLKTLKSTGRGKGVRGRWRNYRNNSTIRGEIWRLLRYKCHLIGLRFHTEQPRGTSHTCPRCGHPAKTYREPSDRKAAVKWGRWMYCDDCQYHGDRDYCASVNVARLGVAYLLQMKHTGKPALARFLTHGSSLSLTRGQRGVAVATDGEPPCPKHSGKDLLLSWLAWVCFPSIVSGKVCFSQALWRAESCLQ